MSFWGRTDVCRATPRARFPCWPWSGRLAGAGYVSFCNLVVRGGAAHARAGLDGGGGKDPHVCMYDRVRAALTAGGLV